MKRSIVTILLLFTTTIVGLAQSANERTITGRVVEAESESPLPGVTVALLNTTTGTTTDVDGNYSIEIPSGTSSTLIFSHIGMQTQEIMVGEQSVINVQMESDEALLDEVIVIAYGTTSREEFVGSAVQLSSRDFETRAISSPTQAIAGSAPGIRVTQGSGQPGSSPTIRIRGIGSVNASNDPLIVLDGVVYTGQLSSINPMDIESFTVLKDAASTALYGSGAANGVVMITTKQGRGGENRDAFSVNLSRGASMRATPAYDRVTAEEYYPLIWEAYRNSLLISGDMSEAAANQEASETVFDLLAYNPFDVSNDQIVGTDGLLNPQAQLLYNDDWWDEIARTGIRNSATFSYGGGNEQTDYYASFGYLDETGYVISSNFERYNARLNVNSRLTEWFKAGINIAGASSEGNNQVDGLGSGSYVNPFRGAMFMGPIYPIYERDPQTGALIEEGLYDRGGLRPQDTGRHIIWENTLNKNIQDNTNLNSRAYGELYFLDRFTFRFNASLDKRYNNREYVRNKFVGDGAPSGDASRRGTITTGVTLNQILNYETQIKSHSVDVMAGHESFLYQYDYQYSNRSGQVVDGNTELINYVNILDGTSYSRDYRKEAYFARANYDYNSKYYLNLSVRRDASSRFHEDVRWSNFWSVGASWRLSQESFMDNIDWITSLRLRASYGEVGNDSNTSHNSLSFYAFQPLYSLDYNNASEAGILLNTGAPGNAFLQWESNKQTDIALEFNLFDNRINGTIEWFNRETSDLLFDVPLPMSTGFEEYPDNIGAMYNRGFELTVDAILARTGSFQWNVQADASTLDNQFTTLPQDEIIDGNKKLMVGHSIYDYWLREWHGVDPADGSALYIADEAAIEADGADIRVIDGNTVTTNPNNARYSYVGTAIPDLYGSFTNSFLYKGIGLSTMFTYQIGGKTYDSSNYGELMHPGSSYGTALHRDIFDRWQEPGDITDVPRLDSSQGSNFGASSSRWLFDSSYLILQNVTLSYDIPASWTSRAGITRASIYASGENLFQITAMKGQEAGQQFSGNTTRRYSPARIITAGINLTF